MEITTIHSEFYHVLNGYLQGRISNKDDAQDILQDVFLKIHTNIHKLSAREKLKSWIFSIAHNAVMDYYRRSPGKNMIEIDEKISDTAAWEQDIIPSQDFDRCMNGFIQKLPADYRNIIIDSEIKGIRQKELSEKYGIAYPTLRSKVQRARIKLRQMILDCCELEFDARGKLLDATPKKAGYSCESCK